MSTELHRIIEELIVDARGSVAGAAQHVRAMNEAERASMKLADAEERARVAREKGVDSYIGPIQSTARLRSEYQKLQASLDPLMAGEMRQRNAMQRAILTTDAAVRRGVATEVEAAATIKRLREQQIVDLKRVREEMDRLAAAQSGAMTGANDNSVAWRRRNTMFQMVDVAQGIPLLFQSPTHGLLNLGNQAAQIGQTYAGQGGVRAAMSDILGMLGPIARGFGPVAAAAGVAALAIAGIRDEAQKTTDVAVSFGDTLKAVIQVIGDAIWNKIRPVINSIAPWVKDALDAALGYMKQFANLFIGAWAGTFDAVRIIWASFPDAMGDLAVQAGNALIRGLEGAINYLIPKIKEFLQFLNPIAKIADAFGNDTLSAVLGTGLLPDKVDWGQFTNEFEGAAKKALGDVTGSFLSALFKDYIGAFNAAVIEQAKKNADDRLAEAIKDQVKAEQDRIAELKLQIDIVGKTVGEVARLTTEFEALAAAKAAAAEAGRSLTQGEVERIRAYAAEVGKLTEQLAAKKAIDDLLFERAQLGRSAIDQKVYAGIRQAGLDINSDLGKRLATDIRINEELARQKEAFASINDLVIGIGQAVAEVFKGAKDSVWDWVDAIAAAIGQVGQLLMGMSKYDWTKGLYSSVSPDALTSASNSFSSASRAVPATYVGPNPSSPAGGAMAASGLQDYVPRAVSSIERTSNAFLSLIRRAEGTAGANGYNTTLGYGAFTGGATNLTGMTLDQIDAMQTAMLRHPNNSYNSSAAGAYQIVRTTLRGLRQELGLSGSQLYNEALQDQLGTHLAQRRGASVSGLRNEWEGLRRVDGGTILAAYGGAANSNVPAAANVNLPQAAPIPTAAPAASGPSGAAGTWGKFAAIGGAAMSGFASGYQAQDPLMGAFSGALGGMGAGPWGMAAGLIGGLIGGFIGLQKAVAEAREQLKKLGPEIENFIDIGMGRGSSQMRNSYTDYLDQAREYSKIAIKARDSEMVERLRTAVNEYEAQIKRDFASTFDGLIVSLTSGAGFDSDFTAAQNAILDLRESVKGLIADAEFTFGADSAQAGQAREAAKAALLSSLDAIEPLSEVATRMRELGGTASVMRQSLIDLGMSGDDAATLIRERLIRSVDKLGEAFSDGLNRSILELADKGYINQIADAQLNYSKRLADAAAVGKDASGAQTELALSLANIAKQSNLTADQLIAFGGAAGVTAGVLADAVNSLEAINSRRLVDEAKSVFDAVLDVWKNFVQRIADYQVSARLNPAVSTLSPLERLNEARTEYERVRDLAAGGDRDAMGKVVDAVTAYRDQAASFWSSSEQYAAIFAETDATLDTLEAQATTQIGIAEQELALAQSQVDGLAAANDNLVTLTQATLDLRAAVDAYLGAGGSFSEPMTASMAAAVSAAQAAVMVSASSVSATEMIARSSAQIADALLALPEVIGSALSAAKISTTPLEVEKMPSLWDRVINSSGSSQGLFERIFNWMPGFADGGVHAGGLRIVGEYGPELEATGPARIWTAQQTRGFLAGSSGNDDGALLAAMNENTKIARNSGNAIIAEMRAMRAELAAAKEENRKLRDDLRAQGGFRQRAVA